MKYTVYEGNYTLEYVEVELDAPKFEAGQTVYSAYTGNECKLYKIAPGVTAWQAPNGAVSMTPAWLCFYRDSHGNAQHLPERAVVATKEEVKGVPRYAAHCPICGGVMHESDSFIDASGTRRHEGC